MKVRHIIAMATLLTALSVPATAQELLVYHVVSGQKNKVKHTDTGKEIARNEKLTLNSKVTVEFDCMLELMDATNKKRYTIQKPGTGTIKQLAANNGSVAAMTDKYVAYVKAQMSKKSAGMRSPQQLYDYATVTRSIQRAPEVADNRSEFEKEFDIFVDDINKEYNEFITKIDEEYTEFVAKAWEEFTGKPAVQRPTEKQVKPQVVENNNGTAKISILKIIKDVKKILRLDKKDVENDETYAKEQPQPIREIPEVKPQLSEAQKEVVNDAFTDDAIKKKVIANAVKEEKAAGMPFTFYGTDMTVRLDETKRFKIGDALDKNGRFEPRLVANVLKGLSSGQYDNFVIDALALRKQYNMGDWAYLQMLKTVTDQFCGQGTNEAALLLGYAYYKSGYRVRYGYDRDAKKIYMLYGSKFSVYSKPSYLIDDIQYYGVEDLPQTMCLCQAEYPETKNLTYFIPSAQKFNEDLSDTRTIQSRRYPDMKVSVKVNKNLVNFYGDVPSSFYDDDPETQWNCYAQAPMAQYVRENLYPQILAGMKGQSDLGKVNRLLDLIQQGMEYEYDDVVWGVPDRIFFSEESLFYPYCDCEDRAILFTHFVRDLVGLPCALVHYKGHLAAAVAFNEEVRGVAWQVDGKNYVICDPTYIGAGAGMEMNIVDHNTAVIIPLPESEFYKKI